MIRLYRLIIPALLLLIAPIIMQARQNTEQWERKWVMKPGVYRVLKNGQIGIVDESGKVLVPCSFDQVYDLDDENYVRVLKNLKIGLYHLEKGIILPAEYDQIWPFVNDKAKVLKNRRMGYVNRDGSTFIPAEYNHIWPEEDGFFKVLKDGKTGLIDTEGNVVVPADFQQIWPFKEGLARVLQNGKLGFIDRNGNQVIPPMYDHVSDFSNGKTLAMMNGVSMYIDEEGRIVNIPEKAKSETLISNENAPKDTIRIQTYSDPAIRIGREQVQIHREGNVREITISPSHRQPKRRIRYFQGNLSGFNLGINSYVDADFNENVPAGYEFMDLIHEKSIEFSIYPAQKSIRLIGSHVGLVSSLGLQYNNYRFDLNSYGDLNENSMAWFPSITETARIGKSKLTTLYLNAPVMLEFHIPDARSRDHLYVGLGVVGGMRLRSHTKVKYSDEGSSFKRKNRDSFDLNPFRYSYIARAGYNKIGIYATYTPISLFKDGKGPELYPYSVGVSFNFN